MLHIITRVVTTITQSKIKEETMICTHQSFASSPTLKSAPKGTNAEERITVLKDYIIKISTRRNFVTASLTRFSNVSMESIVLLLIRLKILRSASYIIYCHSMLTSIFTYFTLKLNGVPTTMNITKHSVYMRITSKILEGSQIFLDMKQSFVRTGKVALSLRVMKKAVKGYKNANSVTDGKSNNFIHLSIKHNHVKSKNALRVLSVHFTIARKIVELLNKMRMSQNYLILEIVQSSALNNLN
jgi:hypothetical protein